MKLLLLLILFILSACKSDDIKYAKSVLNIGLEDYPCCMPKSKDAPLCMWSIEFEYSMDKLIEAYEYGTLYDGKHRFMELIKQYREDLDRNCK